MSYMSLCLRIQFDGPTGRNVSETNIHTLMPWLRNILTSFGLPHPRPTNVLKPPSHNGTSDIDMYWDVVSTNAIVKNVCNRCDLAQTPDLQNKFIVRLMVFFLPHEARGIPRGTSPVVLKQQSRDRTTTTGPTTGTSSSGSHSQPSELEARLLAVLESAGISVPSQTQNLASYIPMLESYIQALRLVAERETAKRMEAEAHLADEEVRHARILLDIKKECKEPFVVPALLDAFVELSETVDSVVSGMNS